VAERIVQAVDAAIHQEGPPPHYARRVSPGEQVPNAREPQGPLGA
jgi:hypothetical protein